MRRTAAYLAGARAWREGRQLHTCPFAVDAMEHDDWRAGWADALWAASKMKEARA